MEEICKNCKWCVIHENTLPQSKVTQEVQVCSFNPPKFPEVSDTDFCSKFEPKQPQNGE